VLLGRRSLTRGLDPQPRATRETERRVQRKVILRDTVNAGPGKGGKEIARA
jgi:hypothetical protein